MKTSGAWKHAIVEYILHQCERDDGRPKGKACGTSWNRSAKKAVMIAATHGLMVKIGSAAYDITNPALVLKKALAADFAAAVVTCRYIARSFHAKRNPVVVMSQKSWAYTKAIANKSSTVA